MVLSPVYRVILCILWVGNSDLGTGPLQPADGCGSEICPEAQRGDGWCPELGVAGKGALTSVGICKASSAAPRPGDHPSSGGVSGEGLASCVGPIEPSASLPILSVLSCRVPILRTAGGPPGGCPGGLGPDAGGAGSLQVLKGCPIHTERRREVQTRS